MRRFGEDPADVEMVSGTEYLQYLQDIALGLSPEVPAGFSVAEYVRRPNPAIYNCCLSPDGRYALLVAYFSDWENAYRLYLLNVETMEISLVETPVGLISKYLFAGTAFNGHKAGIRWKQDGTIEIMTKRGTEAFFRLTVRYPLFHGLFGF